MNYDPTALEVLISLSLGLGLAAACGFRIFVPLLFLSAGSLSGVLQLGGAFDWIGSWPALAIFGVATLLEIGAYFIPWLDNALDTVGAPAAVVAGTVVTASSVVGMDPMLQWTLAAIAGGGAAGIVHGGLALVRGGSTAVTGGLANPLVSAAEAGGSIVVSVLAILVPFAGIVLAVLFMMFAARFFARLRRRGAPA